MISKKELELFRDIARLLSIYGPETFTALAYAMRSPEFNQGLVELLESSPQISNSMSTFTGERKRSDTLRSIKQELEELEEREPDKYSVLLDFFLALQERRALPTLRDLEDFAESSGLSVRRSNKRPQAIARIIRSLMELSMADLVQRLNRASLVTKNESTLQDWSDIILDKGRINRVL